MPDGMSEYMSDRMPDIMSEYASDRTSVGGDHSKKVILCYVVLSCFILFCVSTFGAAQFSSYFNFKPSK